VQKLTKDRSSATQASSCPKPFANRGVACKDLTQRHRTQKDLTGQLKGHAGCVCQICVDKFRSFWKAFVARFGLVFLPLSRVWKLPCAACLWRTTCVLRGKQG
jgi:hypothetical protein